MNNSIVSNNNNNNSTNNNSEYDMNDSIDFTTMPVFEEIPMGSYEDANSHQIEEVEMKTIEMDNGRCVFVPITDTMEDGTVVDYTTDGVVMFNEEMVRETVVTTEQAMFAFTMTKSQDNPFVQDNIRGAVTSMISNSVDHEVAVVAAVHVAKNMDAMINGSSSFHRDFITKVSNTYISNVRVGVMAAKVAFRAIMAQGIISWVDGSVVIGEPMIRIIKGSVSKRFPMDMSKGHMVGAQRDRVKNYSNVNHGTRAENAMHSSEASQYTINDYMVDIAEKVMAARGNKAIDDAVETAMKPVAFAIAGSRMMDSKKAYTSEFNMDNRGRGYQVDRFGPSGQASDMERAMMDFANVAPVAAANVEQAIQDMKIEMWDMVSFKDSVVFDKARAAAVANPVAFIRKNIANISGKSQVKKPWNFVKFASIVAAFERGESPYVGVAIGFDAKCSGPQMMAQMTNSKVMMNRTGVSTTKVTEDAYQAAAVVVEEATGMKFERSDIKKPFMSVFYGAGFKAMTDIETVEVAAHEIMFGTTSKDWIPTTEDFAKAKAFRQAIINSFTAPIKAMKNKMAAAGYDFKAGESKYEVAPKTVMADGFEMAMNYMTKVNIDGEVVGSYNEDGDRVEATDVVINYEGESIVIEKVSFTTDIIDGSSHARNSFVNFTQATDAVMARAIASFTVVHGMQHFVAIHDAFRANIHEVAKMRRVIADANIAIFGVMKADHYSEVQASIIDVNNIDMVGNFFKGVVEAVKYEYKGIAENNMQSQFYNNGMRINTKSVQVVDGIEVRESMKAVFESFVVEGGPTAEYFGK